MGFPTFPVRGSAEFGNPRFTEYILRFRYVDSKWMSGILLAYTVISILSLVSAQPSLLSCRVLESSCLGLHFQSTCLNSQTAQEISCLQSSKTRNSFTPQSAVLFSRIFYCRILNLAYFPCRVLEVFFSDLYFQSPVWTVDNPRWNSQRERAHRCLGWKWIKSIYILRASLTCFYTLRKFQNIPWKWLILTPPDSFLGCLINPP